jgi:hypothetical protein
MIGRGDQHDFGALFGNQLAIIAIRLRALLRALPLRNQIRRLGNHATVDVAQRDDVYGRDLNQVKKIRLAVPATTDQAHSNGFFLAGSKRSRLKKRKRSRASDPGPQEFPPVHHGVAFLIAIMLSAKTFPALNVQGTNCNAKFRN